MAGAKLYRCRVWPDGTLFEGRFKSSIVQDREYLLACLRYIEMNPVRAGIVDDPADYLWSSYRAHAFGVKVRMWTPHPEYQALGPTRFLRLTACRKFFESELDEETVGEIRSAANTGLVVGK